MMTISVADNESTRDQSFRVNANKHTYAATESDVSITTTLPDVRNFL